MSKYTEYIQTFINRLIVQLDKNNEEFEIKDRKSEFNSRLERILSINNFFDFPFNFYPSKHKSDCHELAIFMSLQGDRWDLKKEERLTLEEVFKFLIRHCQGSCADTTKEVVIITDNWSDDVIYFWRHNIKNIKSTGKISIEVCLIFGSKKEYFML